MIRAWLRGRSSKVPQWVMVMQAAAEWHIPPWQVENEASLLWWDRWNIYREEQARFNKAKGDDGDA